MNKKLLYILVIALIVALIWAFYNKAYPSKDIVITDVSNQTSWKTYVYNDLDYSFQAPSTYKLTTNKLGYPNPPAIIQSLTVSEFEASSGKNDFNVSVWESDVESHLKLIAQDNFKKSETTVVNAKQWIVAANALGEMQYLTEHNGRVYTVTGRNKALLLEAINTFNFIK